MTASADGILLLSLKRSGEIQWTRKYGNAKDGYPERMVGTRDGGIVMVGRAWMLRNPDPPTLMTGWVMKLNREGSVQWHRFLKTPDLNELSDVAETADGGFILVGRAAENVSLILRIDHSGTIQWQKTLDIAGTEFLVSVSETLDGGFIAAGQARYSAWLVKLSSRGDLEWQRNYRMTESFAREVRQVRDGGYVVAARVGRRPSDIRIFKVDASGKPQWDRFVGAQGHEDVFGLELAEDGSVLVAGKTNSFGAGDDDIFLLKLSKEGSPLWQHSFGGKDADGGDTAALALDRQGGLLIAAGTRSYRERDSLLVFRTDAAGQLSQCDLSQDVSFRIEDIPLAAAELMITDSGLRVILEAREILRFDANVDARLVCPNAAATPRQAASAAAPPEWPESGTEAYSRYELTRLAAQLLASRQFAELDDLAEELRSSKARFPSGQPKLEYFYDGLEPDLTKFDQSTREQALRAYQDWIQKNPKSLSARIALSNAYLDFAWEARGGGTGDTVNKEAWREFERLSKKALEVLREASSLGVNDPAYYQSMLLVGLALGADRAHMESALERGMELDLEYHGLYTQYAIYLLPRWHGEPGEVERFAERMADRTKKQLGDSLYARIAFRVASFEEEDFFKEHTFSWPRIIQGFRDMEKRYPDSVKNQHIFLMRACQIRDRDSANEILRRPHIRWDSEAAFTWPNRQRFDECRAWAIAPTPTPQPGLQIPAVGEASELGHFTSGWPLLVLENHITLQDGSVRDHGYAFLVRDQSGNVAAVTASSVLPLALADRPEALRAAVKTWDLRAGAKSIRTNAIVATGQTRGQYGPHGLMSSVSISGEPIVRVLSMRPVSVGLSEAIFIPVCPGSVTPCKQVVHSAKVTGRNIPNDGKFAWLSVQLDKKIHASEIVGAPAVDDRGQAVGVVYAATVMPNGTMVEIQELGRILEIEAANAKARP